MLDDWSVRQKLLICDAYRGEATGTIHRWCWPNDELNDLQFGGTHDMPLPQVLQLARQLNGGDDTVDIWGITGENWTPASVPCSQVETAARDVAISICNGNRAMP